MENKEKNKDVNNEDTYRGGNRTKQMFQEGLMKRTAIDFLDIPDIYDCPSIIYKNHQGLPLLKVENNPLIGNEEMLLAVH